MTEVVLLGFGGPEQESQIRPFVDRILEGRRVSPERREGVISHYLAIGGRSPFNELTQRQACALERELARRGKPLGVRTAYRHVPPYIVDAAREFEVRGQEPIAVILSVLQSPASWEAYRELMPRARFTAPFFDRPGVADANAERVRDALGRLGRHDFSMTALIFTAHSIPEAMGQRSPYARQFESLAALVADRCGAAHGTIAYQSRSGAPQDPWLGPDVREALRDLPARGITEAIVAPIGFLCDHVEVLYDLDVAAAAAARDAGVRMERASALNDHPAFIATLADLVEECLT